MTIRPFLRLKHPGIYSVETCIGNDTWRRVTRSLIGTKSGHMTATQKNLAKHKLLKPCEPKVVFRLMHYHTGPISSIYTCTRFFYGLKVVEILYRKKGEYRMIKKRQKKRLRRRKRIWHLSGNPLERVWKLILTKKMQIACTLMPLQRCTQIKE